MTLRIPRSIVGIPLLASLALLSPASAQAPVSCAHSAAALTPTKLEYLVMASVADSSSALSLSSFSATRPRSD